VPTIRDSDGLALSSRNAQLSEEQRKRAAALPSALFQARNAIRGGEPVANALRQAKQALVDAGFLRIDYVALVDGQALEPVEAIEEGSRLIAAAVIGTTRLIDNIAV
jgi:pantoate--beta-alanine ligase